MSTEQAAESQVEQDDYGTVDEIHDTPQPQASEAELQAAAEGQNVQFDDTPGELPAGVQPTQLDDAGNRLDLVEKVQQTQQNTEPTDAYPVEESATPNGDGQQQDAVDGSEFDAALLQAAGLEESEARARFGTPEALENAIRLMDERSIGVFQQYANQWQQQQPQQPQPQQYQQPPQAQQQQAPSQADAYPAQEQEEVVDELPLPEPSDGEEWDDDVIAIVQAVTDHFNAKLDQQRQEFEQQIGQTQQVTNAWLEEQSQAVLADYVEEFDGFVDSLGDEWTSVLGKGPGYEMDLQSPEIQARAHLDTVSKQIEFGRQAQGLPALPRKQLLDRALRVAFPNNQEQSVRRQVEGEVEKRSRMKTTRPGNTMKKQPSAEDTAVSRAEKWYADRGLGPVIGDEFDYDEI